MSWSHFIYPGCREFNEICSYYSLKHLQKCIQTEKDDVIKKNLSKFSPKNQINTDIDNVSSLKTKEACIDIMNKYNISLDANINDMIMGPHLKVLLLQERDKYLDTLGYFNELLHKSPRIDPNYIIELKEQIKLEQAENERLRKKIEEYQLLVEDNKALEIERASHAKTKLILQKYENRLLNIFAD